MHHVDATKVFAVGIWPIDSLSHSPVLESVVWAAVDLEKGLQCMQ